MPAETTHAQPPETEAIHECPGGQLGLVTMASGHRLVALRPVAVGQLILRIDGELASLPSRHSVQIDTDVHVAPAAAAAGQHPLDHGYWRYLNHSCDPNATLRGRALLALRDIAANDDVTFDYNPTEWDMAEPFACHCGSAVCLGTIRGFAHLSPAHRARLHGAAPHLLALLASDPS